MQMKGRLPESVYELSAHRIAEKRGAFCVHIEVEAFPDTIIFHKGKQFYIEFKVLSADDEIIMKYQPGQIPMAVRMAKTGTHSFSVAAYDGVFALYLTEDLYVLYKQHRCDTIRVKDAMDMIDHICAPTMEDLINAMLDGDYDVWPMNQKE